MSNLEQLLSTLEINPDGEHAPEYVKYLYKSYALGITLTWHKYIPSNTENKIKVSDTRIIKFIHAVPIVKIDNKFNLDPIRAKETNPYIVCPIGGKIQTYNMGALFNTTPIKQDWLITLKTSEEIKDEICFESLSRVLKFIDLIEP